jgi:UDP-2,3-diacylglucosamine hydrolase
VTRDDLFISDLHLDERTADRQAVMERFLRRHASRAARLFILGDLFNAWIGRKQLDDPHVAELLQAIRRATQAGVEVHFVAGNRDFYGLNELAARSGMVTHRRGFAVDSLGQRVWVCHGHDLCLGDRRTRSAQAVTHARPVEWIFQALPAGLTRFLAQGYKNHSARVVHHKERRDIQIADRALAELFDQGCQIVVCGHTHHLEHWLCRSGDRLGHVYNLGCWDRGPHFLRHGADGWHFHRLGPANS